MRKRWKAGLVASLVAAGFALSACAPLLVGAGATLGTLSALDRRTVGAQTEDELIELKGRNRLTESMRNAGGIGVTSYNRKVLLTGQVLSAEDKSNATKVIASMSNVRSVDNELQVSGRVSMGVSASDALITTRVKTALLDSNRVQANTIKVVTEASVVYLMGIVTAAEGAAAADIASRASGVARVVTVFETISNDDLQRIKSEAEAKR
ncbi:MAG: BON domain-containing protein [Burkholderiaceae bacterium]|nr:BON domain-containing protein [Burkholderiaceae bacterium]